ncbi:hypothetical protein MNV49_003596 [Pseudohyphozyma bogoriensis]|nr:hypothetical protein MNV49_003596 [Pseudohyphozyma bogoriensis]
MLPSRINPQGQVQPPGPASPFAQSQQQQQQRFPFGAAAAAEASLDPSDFPALSSAPQSSSWGQPQTPLSYASQASTMPPMQQQQQPTPRPSGADGASAPPPSGQGFSQDDFPALGGFGELGAGAGLPGRRVVSTPGGGAFQQQEEKRFPPLGPQSKSSLPSAPTQSAAPAAPAQPWSTSPTFASTNGPLSPPQTQATAPQQHAIGSHPSTASLPTSSTAPPPLQTNGTAPPGTAVGATGVGNGQPQTPAQQILYSPADRYGLLGLLEIIRNSDRDPDLAMLALGSDLGRLGLDLGGEGNLYSTFITPWSDSKTASQLNIEPEFHLPSCYNVQPPPAQTKIGNFSDETLFFIFYSQPRDAMQEMAAHELYKHNWRYHKELRLWLTKEAGTEPTQKTASYERGSFFDPTLWERVRKDFVLVRPCCSSLHVRGVVS